MSHSTPYWRMSGFYLVYFASLGALVPYWSLYLQSLSFDARAIGELMAIIMATKFVAPYVWGWIADHTGKGMLIIRIASVCALLAFTGVFLNSGFWWMAVVMAVFSFFWNATLPQFEANTMNHLGKDTHKYSVIRLWGSLGFILSVVVLGHFLDSQGLALIPLVILFFYFGIALFSFLVPDGPGQTQISHHGHIFDVLKQEHLTSLTVCLYCSFRKVRFIGRWKTQPA